MANASSFNQAQINQVRNGQKIRAIEHCQFEKFYKLQGQSHKQHEKLSILNTKVENSKIDVSFLFQQNQGQNMHWSYRQRGICIYCSFQLLSLTPKKVHHIYLIF